MHQLWCLWQEQHMKLHGKNLVALQDVLDDARGNDASMWPLLNDGQDFSGYVRIV